MINCFYCKFSNQVKINYFKQIVRLKIFSRLTPITTLFLIICVKDKLYKIIIIYFLFHKINEFIYLNM